MTREEGSEVV